MTLPESQARRLREDLQNVANEVREVTAHGRYLTTQIEVLQEATVKLAATVNSVTEGETT